MKSYTAILLGREAIPPEGPRRVYRPGNLAGLDPLKPYDEPRFLAWFDDLHRRGIGIRYDGEVLEVWGPEAAALTFSDLARCEVNFDRILKVKGVRPQLRRGVDSEDCLAGIHEARERAEPPPLPPQVLLTHTAASFHKVDLDASRPLSSLPLAFVDTETTGRRVRRGDRIIEIAICRIDPGQAARWLVSLVNPDGRSSAEGAQATHGLTDEILKPAPKFEALASEVRRLLSACVFIGYNPPFDLDFIRPALLSVGYPWEPSAVVDVEELARRLVPGFESYSQKNLAASLGIPLDTAHRARGDVVTLRKIANRVIPPGSTLSQLQEIEKRPRPLVPGKPRGDRRGAESPAEEWAIETLLRLDEAAAFANDKDDEMGGSFSDQYRHRNQLSPKQWIAAVGIAKRYGQPPRE